MAATDAFRDHGPDASLEEIARRANVGSATLHRHFRGRKALLAVVYRTEVEALVAAATDAGEHGLWSCLQLVLHHCSTDRALLATLEAGGGEEPKQSWDSLRSVVNSLVDEAHGDGTLRADVLTDDLMRLVDAMARATAGQPDHALRLFAIMQRGCS